MISLRTFGLMPIARHHDLVADLHAEHSKATERLASHHVTLAERYLSETGALRQENIDLRNQLAIERGKRVAAAHAKGKPAP